LKQKVALICGVSGQDGSYLAKFLLGKGYEVWGTSRDVEMASFLGLKALDIYHLVNLVSMSMTDFRGTLDLLRRVQPDEIYNLAGQSSVGLSFEQPMDTLESIAMGTLNLLECIRYLELDIRFYNAASSECFGGTDTNGVVEESPFRPISPYGVAKAASVGLTSTFKKAYNIRACSGLLFNHESPLRPVRFVTRKISHRAAEIACGGKQKLILGNLDVQRDWGWAPEYVEAMWLMLQLDQPEDLIICTGETISLKDFVSEVFKYFDLDWLEHVEIDPRLLRSSDHLISSGSPARASEVLGWKATSMPLDVARMMAAAAFDEVRKT
jgi:GDPmannose 4,6-dehydratase